jgi:hypothetical protein
MRSREDGEFVDRGDTGYLLQSLLSTNSVIDRLPGVPQQLSNRVRKPKHLAIALVVVIVLVISLLFCASQLENPNP